MGTDIKANARGGGAFEVLDLRIFNDGGEIESARGSDAVVPDTEKHGEVGAVRG